MSSSRTELRKQPRQSRSRALVDAVVEATARLMASEGVAAVTTARVAELAGVSIGSLYQYFPAREALIAAVVDHKIATDQALARPFVEALVQASLDEAICGLVELLMRFYRDETQLYREMIAAQAEVEREAQVAALEEGFEGAILRVLEPHRLAISGQLESCAWLIRTLLLSCVREAAAHRPEAFAKGLLSRQLEAACRGILGVPQPQMRGNTRAPTTESAEEPD